MKQTPETIILLNFVCEDIQKAARLVRDSGIYTMVMPYTTSPPTSTAQVRIPESEPRATAT